MSNIIIKKSNRKVDRIVHLSDIHISNNEKNHKKYQFVFNNLYKSLDEYLDPEDNNIIG